MYTILVIILVAVTQAEIQSCTEFCMGLSSGRSGGSKKNGCKCHPEKQIKPQAFQPWTDLGPILRLDESGIYYEPADLARYSHISFVDQPFYILNPGFRLSIDNLPDSKFDELIETLHKHDNYPGTKTDKPTKKNQRIENIIRRNANDNNREVPLYIDVEIENSRNKERFFPEEVTKIDNFNLTEEDLARCVDLHILAYSRKNSKLTELKKMWGTKKFQKFYNMTNIHLNKEIESKCSHPANVVEQSLREIKESWPKKNEHIVRLPHKLHDGTRAHKTQKHTTEATTSTSSEQSATSNDSTQEVVTHLTDHHNDITRTTSETWEENTDEADIETFTPASVARTEPITDLQSRASTNINVQTSEKNNTHHKSHNNETSKMLSTRSTVTSSKLLSDKDNIATDLVQNKVQYPLDSTKSVTENLKTEMPSTFQSQTFNNYNINPLTTESATVDAVLAGDIELSTKNAIVDEDGRAGSTTILTIDDRTEKEILTTPHTTQSYLNFDQKEDLIQIPSTDKNKYTQYEENVTTDTSKSSPLDSDFGASNTVSRSENPNVHDENYVEIPKVISREYPNNTVSSFINGTEQRTNDDLMIDDNDSVKLEQAIDSKILGTQRMLEKNNISRTSTDANADKKVSRDIVDTNITGHLNFLFGSETIPARFTQEPNGKIHLGIDGISLCNKLNVSETKSVLLNVICNCVQSNKCIPNE